MESPGGAALAEYARPPAWGEVELIDADVQVTVPALSALTPYLESRWRDYLTESGMGKPESNLYPAAEGVFLPGSRPPDGPPGSSLDLTRAQLLDPWRVGLAITNCTFAVDTVHNDDLAAALATAVNRWQYEHWLRPEPRLRGSLVVPVQNPALAVAEIERWAGHPEFVQVTLPARSREPLGRRAHWPIFAAAERAGLVIGIQAGGASGNPITPVGWPTYYLEDYVAVAQAFQNQVLSLVSEGVFAEFGDLRVVLIEAGFTWLPALMWRFDKNWKGLRREVPWVRQPPSEIIRQRIRLTVQPLDAPAADPRLLQVIDQLGDPGLLLFSTDYPHLQFPAPDAALPAGLPDDLSRAILGANARDTYRLARS